MLKLNWIVWMSNGIAFTFGNDANTCCLTSQTRRSDGNCSDLKTFNSGTCTRTKSHPSRGSGGGSSSKPSPPAKIGDWSIVYLLVLVFFRFSHCCVLDSNSSVAIFKCHGLQFLTFLATHFLLCVCLSKIKIRFIWFFRPALLVLYLI